MRAPRRSTLNWTTLSRTRLVFLSEWGSWDALRSHRDSALLEDKVIAEFGPKIGAAGIGKRTYVEVGPEPY